MKVQEWCECVEKWDVDEACPTDIFLLNTLLKRADAVLREYNTGDPIREILAMDAYEQAKQEAGLE